MRQVVCLRKNGVTPMVYQNQHLQYGFVVLSLMLQNTKKARFVEVTIPAELQI